jgi:hypothetical protein
LKTKFHRNYLKLRESEKEMAVQRCPTFSSASKKNQSTKEELHFVEFD